jgi:hypothetical protein
MLRFLFRRRRLAVKLPDTCFPLMGGHGGASIYIDLHKKGAGWVWPSSEWRRRRRWPGVLGVHGLMWTGGKYFVCGGRPSLTRGTDFRSRELAQNSAVGAELGGDKGRRRGCRSQAARAERSRLTPAAAEPGTHFSDGVGHRQGVVEVAAERFNGYRMQIIIK